MSKEAKGGQDVCKGGTVFSFCTSTPAPPPPYPHYIQAIMQYILPEHIKFPVGQAKIQ